MGIVKVFDDIRQSDSELKKKLLVKKENWIIMTIWSQEP